MSTDEFNIAWNIRIVFGKRPWPRIDWLPYQHSPQFA